MMGALAGALGQKMGLSVSPKKEGLDESASPSARGSGGELQIQLQKQEEGSSPKGVSAAEQLQVEL